MLLSMNVLFWQVNKLTLLAVAPWLVVVSGAVLGVKAPVYNAWFLVMRTLEM